MMIRLSLRKLAILGASILAAQKTTAFVVSPSLSPAKIHNSRRAVSENPAATLAMSSKDDDDSSTYAKAPPVKADLYEESIATLYGKCKIFYVVGYSIGCAFPFRPHIYLMDSQPNYGNVNKPLTTRTSIGSGLYLYRNLGQGQGPNPNPNFENPRRLTAG